MGYVLLSPRDQRKWTWVLFELRDRLELREQYTALRCPNRICKKVNEDAALAQGIDPAIRVPVKADYVLSEDGFMFFSKRLVELFERESVGGFKPIPLPGDPNYVIATPTCLVPTDREGMAIEIHRGVCEVCGRPKETTFLPTLSSLTVPPERLILFASEVWAENSRGRLTWFTTTTEVAELMKASRVTGVEYKKPY